MADNATLRKKPSLGDFGVRAEDREASTVTTPKRTKGQKERVAVAVRLERDDWMRVHEFALHEGTSLQELIVSGLSMLMQSRGLRPLDGK